MKGLAPNSVFSSSQIYKVQMTNCQPNYTKACLHNSAFKKTKSCVCWFYSVFVYFNKTDILFEGLHSWQPRKWGFCEAVLIKNEHILIIIITINTFKSKT